MPLLLPIRPLLSFSVFEFLIIAERAEIMID